MEWTEAIREAVRYIENHLTEEITMYDVAAHVNISQFYFHKGFSILCGYSITEYIRNRRLALAGEELIGSDTTVTAKGIYPVSRIFAICRAQGQNHAQGVCPAAINNIFERWLCDGLQNYRQSGFYSAGGVQGV